MVELVCNNLSVKARLTSLLEPPQISEHCVFASVMLLSGYPKTHQSMVNFMLTRVEYEQSMRCLYPSTHQSGGIRLTEKPIHIILFGALVRGGAASFAIQTVLPFAPFDGRIRPVQLIIIAYQVRFLRTRRKILTWVVMSLIHAE